MQSCCGLVACLDARVLQPGLRVLAPLRAVGGSGRGMGDRLFRMTALLLVRGAVSIRSYNDIPCRAESGRRLAFERSRSSRRCRHDRLRWSMEPFPSKTISPVWGTTYDFRAGRRVSDSWHRSTERSPYRPFGSMSGVFTTAAGLGRLRLSGAEALTCLPDEATSRWPPAHAGNPQDYCMLRGKPVS